MSTIDPASFPLGVNYWPARAAMGFWHSFDRTEVDADFARIADAGFDSVRLFLTWEDFQPTVNTVNPVAVARLLATLDSASEMGLVVMPTLFTGHMSGVNWIPPWALGQASGDARFRVVSNAAVVNSRLASWYTDSVIMQAQSYLARQVASAAAGHPALWAWDLGNENSNCGAAPSKASARAWLGRITDAIREGDAAAKITIGLHMEDLEHDRCMGPQEAAAVCDFLTMHGYPGYAPWTSGATDERLLPFLCRLTGLLGGGAAVLFSEFGVPTRPNPRRPNARRSNAPEAGPALVTESEAGAYVERALRALRQCGSMGAMLWCYTDYVAERFKEPPFDLAIHERSFGLWRADGSPKPSVAAVQSFVRQKQLSPAEPLEDGTWFDLDVEAYYLAPERELPRLYARYCKAAQDAASK